MEKYREKRRTRTQSYSITEHDRQLIEMIADFHGCGKSEAVRNAVRFYAGEVSWQMANNKR